MSSLNLFSTNSLLAQRVLRVNISDRNSSLHKLATGLRINKASDDPAALISSENLRAILKALEAETRTTERARDVVNTAEGSLSEVSDLLNEAQALVVKNANTAGLSSAEREANQIELDSILSTVNRLSSTTSFNEDKLLDGTASITVNDQTINIDSVATGSLGETTSGGETYTLSNLKSGGGLDLVNGDLRLAQEVLLRARSEVASSRGALGAFSRNNIDSHLNNLAVSLQNIASAESKIRDTDYGSEASNLARLSILVTAARDAVKFTNAAPLNVLNLLA